MSIPFYSGNTGVSTGPHIDFRVWDVRKGGYVDPHPYRSIMRIGGKPITDQLDRFPMTSGYGLRVSPTAGASSWHRGHDYHAPAGTRVDIPGARLIRQFWDKGGGLTNHYAFVGADGRELEALLMHGDADLNPRALKDWRSSQELALTTPSAPTLPPPASHQTQVETPAPAPSPPDWRAAASDPTRITDPTDRRYWDRIDIQQWSQANPLLAARAMTRYGVSAPGITTGITSLAPTP